MGKTQATPIELVKIIVQVRSHSILPFSNKVCIPNNKKIVNIGMKIPAIEKSNVDLMKLIFGGVISCTFVVYCYYT